MEVCRRCKNLLQTWRNAIRSQELRDFDDIADLAAELMGEFQKQEKDESGQGRCLIGIIEVQPSSTARKIAKKHRGVSWLWRIKPKEEVQSTETLTAFLCQVSL